ncbi:MAG TPA: IS91 family transposase [Polyangiales bacterium]
MAHEPRCLRGTARPAPAVEVADIVRADGGAFARSHALSIEQRRALRAIVRCRSAALGGHLEVCTDCGEQRPAYNSCRNRHCPKCQALPQARWVERQMERVLPVKCFHVVFTLPAELRPLARRHGRHLYELLLRSASSTLLTLGRDRRWLGAELGITAVLHTWARDLSLHPHAHCIVTAGGLSLDGGRWVDAQRAFLFPVAVMARLFRGRFLAGLCRLRRTRGVGRHLGADAFDALLRQLYAIDWNVYCKAPFAGPEQIFRYLGQYTHRVGITNHRLLGFDGQQVTFRTRGADTVTIDAQTFLARFLSHVLPHRFVKIRHSGLLANGPAVFRRERARQLLVARGPTPPRVEPAPVVPAPGDWQQLLEALTGIDLRVCRRCGRRAVVRVPLPSTPTVLARAPPAGEVAA